METSLLWALRPELVDVSRIPPHVQGEVFAMGRDAHLADRRVGERMVADQIEWLGAKGEELLAAYRAERPAHNFTTFAAVEQAWTQRVEPVLPAFRTLQRRWDWQPEDIPPDSPWNRNR